MTALLFEKKKFKTSRHLGPVWRQGYVEIDVVKSDGPSCIGYSQQSLTTEFQEGFEFGFDSVCPDGYQVYVWDFGEHDIDSTVIVFRELGIMVGKACVS